MFYQRDHIPEGSVTCGPNECSAQTEVTDSFENAVKYFQHPVVLMEAAVLSLFRVLSVHYDADVNGD